MEGGCGEGGVARAAGADTEVLSFVALLVFVFAVICGHWAHRFCFVQVNGCGTPAMPPQPQMSTCACDADPSLVAVQYLYMSVKSDNAVPFLHESPGLQVEILLGAQHPVARKVQAYR